MSDQERNGMAATRIIRAIHNDLLQDLEESAGVRRGGDSDGAALAQQAVPQLTGCNCRWDGGTQVQWCELHLAHKQAIHDWAERAKTAEALREMLDDARAELAAVREALGVPQEPHQSLQERTLQAAKQRAAKAGKAWQCHKCTGNSLTHATFCPQYNQAEARAALDAQQAVLTINAPNGDKIVTHGTAVDMMTLDRIVKSAARQAEREPLSLAVVDAARAAMDESFEAGNEQMDIAIPAHLAAALSLRLDEHDRASGVSKEGK